VALNEKQQRFVEAYLIDPNATKAAERAGYSGKTAYSQGQRLLKHAEVQKALQEARQGASERTKVTTDDLITWLAEIARSKGSADRDRIAAMKLLGEHLGSWKGEGGKRTDDQPAADPETVRNLDPADAVRLYREAAKAADQV
jgi:hypothetical protein